MLEKKHSFSKAKKTSNKIFNNMQSKKRLRYIEIREVLSNIY